MRSRWWRVLFTVLAVWSVVTVALEAWLPGRWAAALGLVAGSVLAFVAGGAQPGARDRRSRNLAVAPRRVRELTDPVALGVLRAGANVPAYVRRDVQGEVFDALTEGGFVLLVGESAAGKTRLAYEAMRAHLPDHDLVAPSQRRPFDAVLATVARMRRGVVWLDDLERFLGADGLTAETVGQLSDGAGRHVVLLATMRSQEYDAFGAHAEPHGERRDVWRAGRDVLRLAREVRVERMWSADEVDRARGFADDPRVERAVRAADRFGVGETLAAGPQLVADWRDAWVPGRHPRGAALVAAAVDCRRAGLADPVSRDLLVVLHETYLDAHGGAGLRPETVGEAFAWASDPTRATSSLLLPHGPDRYLAFDYLVDLPDHRHVPDRTWHLLTRRATPRQAFGVGRAAFGQGRYGDARDAFARAAEAGIGPAARFHARSVALGGDPDRALRLLRDLLDRAERDLGTEDPHTVALREEVALWTG